MSQIQRSYVRKSLDISLNISFRILGESQAYKIDKVLDISYGGLKILCEKKIDVNTDISISILIDDYKLKFVCEVKRCEEAPGGYEIGLMFITISKKNLKKLYQLIK